MAGNANFSSAGLTDGRVIGFSYGVAVAAFIPGRGWIKDETFYSVTTSKHANGFAGKDAPKVPAAEFAAAIAPVSVRS